MAEKQQTDSVPGPLTPCNCENERRKSEERHFKLEAASHLIEIMSTVRQACICHGQGDLTPKEEAAYLAALNHLEMYLDGN